jgi:hypothetical protein
MRIKANTFHDFWRGNGVFAALILKKSSYLIAVRPNPKHWRLDCVEPPAKPGVTRWYFGPFEFERAKYSPFVKPIL